MKRLQIGLRVGRRADLRLGDDLHQGHAATVEVDQAPARERSPSGYFVEQLAGVLLQVEPMDAHGVPRRQGDAAPLGQGLVVLADLVALGQVGIEVVLACEHRPPPDFAAEGQRQPYGQIDRVLVRHRQRARIAETDRADEIVRFGAEAVLATAEHLRPGA